ncbi:hypothetical protein [Moorena sp. SIO4G3]|uniref:hypothetical protein n=1 Tax=Moorena sp. SIO4G3 TaxID=2607821 RepID=UPI00142C388B|nr:hypothetical protein [Moorena sp. SIO4G3]NEO80756.1 hypothetical protein [Moorena sp. SIO4G3]
MGGTTAVAHGGDPQDRAASPRPRCLPKTALHRLSTIKNYKASNFVSRQPSAVSRQLLAHATRSVLKINLERENLRIPD